MVLVVLVILVVLVAHCQKDEAELCEIDDQRQGGGGGCSEKSYLNPDSRTAERTTSSADTATQRAAISTSPESWNASRRI